MKKVQKRSLFTFSWKLPVAALLAVGLLLFIGILCIPEKYCINGLNTMEEARWYADHYPELPDMDNTNMVRPDYSSFYRAHHTNLVIRKWRAFCHLIGIYTRFTWSPQYFTALVTHMNAKLKSYKVEKNIVYKIKPTAATRFVVIGDLGGAYHSLVRNLEKMKDMGIFDENMKLVAADTYLVFMGSAISRSPYGMETLGLILRLLEVNADAVVYLRGNHEDNKYWEAFGLKEQLEIALGHEVTDIVNIINDLFNHLPIGLYVPLTQNDHYVRISHLSRTESTKLKEDSFGHFLEAKQQGPIDRHEIDKAVQHNDKVAIDAIIHSEKKRHTYQASDGMRQLPADDGAMAWTIMSAPTLVNQKGFQCFNDAFVIVQAAEKKDDWTATLYFHDSRKPHEDFKTTVFSFFNGGAAGEKSEGEAKQESTPAVASEEKDATAAVIKDSSAAIEKAIHSPLVQLLAGKMRKKAPGVRPFIKI